MKTMHRLSGAGLFALALFATGGALTAQQSTSTTNNMIASMGDLNAAQLVEVRDKTGQVLLQGTLMTKGNTLKEVERTADLTSPSGQSSKGEIEIQIKRKDGVVTRNTIELDVENLAAMVDCEVFIDGRAIGTFITSKRGKGDLKRDLKVDPSR